MLSGQLAMDWSNNTLYSETFGNQNQYALLGANAKTGSYPKLNWVTGDFLLIQVCNKPWN